MNNISNNLTAKVIGEILSEGMSISEVDLTERVKCEAISALGEIKGIIRRSDFSESSKIKAISDIINIYNI